MLTIDAVLDCLVTHRQRATYEAVSQVLNSGQGGARNVKWHLIAWNERHGHSGEYRGPHTSWVVYKSGTFAGEPAGYDESDAVKHPDLYQSRRVLETGQEIQRLCGESGESTTYGSDKALKNSTRKGHPG